eukprot:CAMPEP_0115385526 /NCGR_PEP_ID=MMETSP0271-20121206/7676_1 /TAXON_ID=71861 /ORGANISM="Scrippsiella trochoidea, Strain CCMP3099" /LENGTH=152 /DNA_ID=CAMNT_0002808929 /DNA_START=18 /DNA_END=476 /DNA_ORIENTATION=+
MDLVDATVEDCGQSGIFTSRSTNWAVRVVKSKFRTTKGPALSLHGMAIDEQVEVQSTTIEDTFAGIVLDSVVMARVSGITASSVAGPAFHTSGGKLVASDIRATDCGDGVVLVGKKGATADGSLRNVTVVGASSGVYLSNARIDAEDLFLSS